MPFINHDGLICTDDEAIFSSRNNAFRLGEGLIETMLSAGGSIRLLDLHLQRLRESLDTLGFPAIDEERLQQEISKTSAANGFPREAVIRAQFYMNLEDEALHFIIEVMPYSAFAPRKEDITIGIAQSVVKCYDSISHLKTSSRMLYRIAAKEARKHGWDDALVLNPQGRVVESTHSNIFVVKANKIYTPPLSEGCINGVFRKSVLDQTAYPVTEQELDIKDLTDADELFLTNAVRRVQAVKMCMGKAYGSIMTQKISDWVTIL